jgi:arginase family enzyme
LISLDMVEVNPVLDQRNRTARAAAELILAMLGRQLF